MCGIVGAIGRVNAQEFVLGGLEALEYRGYDSAGIASLVKGAGKVTKQVGRVEALKTALRGNGRAAGTAIGHTRWATHGPPTLQNAHPHFNSERSIFVVHNGIIENYQKIRDFLQSKGYKFVSDTDTEVIPHLLDYHFGQNGSFVKAFEKTLKELRGAYAVAVITAHEPDKIFVARLSSPLVIGVGKHAHFVASDATALMDKTKRVIYLNDYEYAVIAQDKTIIKDIKKATRVTRAAEELDFDPEKATLGDFPHYMLKEIYEAPQTVQSAIRGRIRASSGIVKLGGLENVREQLRYIDRVVIVACGTSYYAGLVGEYLIEEIAGLPVEVQLASEFKYRDEPFSRSTALLAISQSGETADTIAAIKKVENYGVLRLGIVNAVGSTIARMTDAGVYCHAGPEQSVASTKAFIAQVTVLCEIALHLSGGRSPLYKPLLNELECLPDKLQLVLKNAPQIEEAAKKYSEFRDFLYIGRRYGYPCALEGALKLKEISYIHAEGYAGGEMKHGPLAMIDGSFPTFAIACDSPLLDKTLSNIEEIKARGGPVLAIATSGNRKMKSMASDTIYIPKILEQLQPILVAVVLQLFSYYVAVKKGMDVDRPRNLAKSVTVE